MFLFVTLYLMQSTRGPNAIHIYINTCFPMLIEQLDIVATFEMDNEALQSTVEASAGYKCSTSDGAVTRGIFGPFGILVLADESLSEKTPVYFYISKGPNGSAKTHFCADQSRFASILNLTFIYIYKI